MTIKFIRVSSKHVHQIISLFTKIFSKEISTQFYHKRYFLNNKFNSFIAIRDETIIGHVGFVKHKLTISNFYTYSRHTSMVLKQYRQSNIYTNLCKFAYNKLLNKNLLGFVIFPNKLNVDKYIHLFLHQRYSNFLVR